MLSDEQLWEARQSVYEPGSRTAFERSEEYERDELRAVEAAVRAEQAIECNNARFGLLYVIHEARGLLNELDLDAGAVTAPGTAWGSILRDAKQALSQSPTDALQAVKAAAWDEGYGDDDDCQRPRTNPYRKDKTDE